MTRDGNLPRIPVETFYEPFKGIGGFFEAAVNRATGTERARRMTLNVAGT